MITLNEIKAQQLQARKNKEPVKTSLLTTFIGEVQSKLTALPIDKRTEQKEVELVEASVKFFLDKNREAQQIVKDVQKLQVLKEEEEILKVYEPARMSEDELRAIIKQNFPEVNQKNKGPIVGFLKKNYGNAIDGNLAKQVIDSLVV